MPFEILALWHIFAHEKMQSTTDPKASFVLEHELPLAKQNLTKAFDATFQKSILLLKKRNNALELSP